MLRPKFSVERVKGAGYERIQEFAKVLHQRGLYVKVGVTGTEAQQVHDQNGEFTNAQVAVAMEYGVPSMNVPARPWISAAYRKHLDEYRKALVQAYAEALRKAAGLEGRDYETNLKRIGAKMAADIKEFVKTRQVVPQLDPSGRTYQRKLGKGAGRGGTPIALIDSSTMIRSVTWKLGGSGGEEQGEHGGE